MRRKIKQKLLVLGTVLVAVVFLGQGCGGLEPPEDDADNLPKFELVYWSVFNNSEDVNEIINAYRLNNPNVTIEYKKLEIDEYEDELIDALASGRGPDIFSIHHSWLPRYTDKLEPLPVSQVPLAEYVPVVEKATVLNDMCYGLPYSVDTLALFYNPKLLSSASVPSPPTTWDEFDQAVKQLVLRDDRQEFIREGAAMGAVNNVNRGIDPLLLLMTQNGAQIINAENTEATFADSIVGDDNIRYSPGLAALNKYMDYSRSTSSVYTWNNQLPNAFDEFASSKLGMFFNYAFNLEKTEELLTADEVRVAEAPQVDPDNPTAYASLWLEGVSTKSESQLEAWKFILFATGLEGAKLYVDATNRPSSRIDVLDVQKSDRRIGPFARQAFYADIWYQENPQAFEAVFADMVNSIVNGERSRENALQQAEIQVTNLLK
ncbi:ABC transporter substrate-binding protein [Patescibacteria group bacterium]